MKKFLFLLSTFFFATAINAECWHVEGEIISEKCFYDANKNFLYSEVEGTQYYSRDIEASSRDYAKQKAMQECESMCYDNGTVHKIENNGNVVGYYKIMRRTRISSCEKSWRDCD